ncbi:unnamed protein product [Urochloa humidicola]
MGLPLCFAAGLSTTQSCPSLLATARAPFVASPAGTSFPSAAACCLLFVKRSAATFNHPFPTTLGEHRLQAHPLQRTNRRMSSHPVAS